MKEKVGPKLDKKLPLPCRYCDNRKKDKDKGIIGSEDPCHDGKTPLENGDCEGFFVDSIFVPKSRSPLVVISTFLGLRRGELLKPQQPEFQQKKRSTSHQ